MHRRLYNEYVKIYLTPFPLIDIWLVSNFWLLTTTISLDTWVSICLSGITRLKEEYLHLWFSCIQLNCPPKWLYQLICSHLVHEGFLSYTQQHCILSMEKKHICQQKRWIHIFCCNYNFANCQWDGTPFIYVLNAFAHFSVELQLLNYNYCSYFFLVIF